MPIEEIHINDVASKSETEAALALKQDKIEDVIIIKSTPGGKKFEFRVDDTGMPILPMTEIP